MSILEQAKRLRERGVSVIPIRLDGSKAPALPTWKQYQERLPTDQELIDWWGNGVKRGYADVQGRGRELLDFDPNDAEEAKLFDEFKKRLEKSSPGLFAKLSVVETPGLGHHLRYRTGIAEGNQKLAQVPEPDPDDPTKMRPRTLFETRGVGGYALGTDNPLEAHTIKRPYRLLSGPAIEDAPLITDEQRNALFEAARSFNRWVDKPRDIVPDISDYEIDDPNDVRPGTLFNRTATWEEILEPHDWTNVGGTLWRRPDKSYGTSAQAFDDPPVLIVYSSNAYPFEPWSGSGSVTYTKFSAYALLNHAGDFSEAAAALREKGYCDEPPTIEEQEDYFEATIIEMPTDQNDLASGEVSEPALAPLEKAVAAIVAEIRQAMPTPTEKKKRATKEDTAKLYEDITAKFLAEQIASGKPVLFTGGQTYTYNGTRYAPCVELPVLLRTFAHRYGYPRSNNVIGNVVNLVQADSWQSADEVGRMPFWRGRGNPFRRSKDVIAFTNGLLDITEIAKGLRAHSSSWCSTVCLPFAFEPAAVCPLWRKFLAEVLDADAGSALLLQEFFGYCLTTDTSLQKAVILLGKSRSGKGTIQRILAALIGSDNVTGLMLDSLARDFGLSPLLNKTVAIIGEVELSANAQRSKIIEVFKSIIGEDEMCVNIKHCDPLSTRLSTRFVIAANTLPRFMDASGAMLQRLLFVPFDQSFRNREDPELTDKLITELPGIANWAIEGLNRLRRNAGRFTLGDSHKRTADKYANETTPVLAWLSERALVSKWADPGDLPESSIVQDEQRITKAAAFADFERWVSDRNVMCNPDQMFFGKDIATLLPRVRYSRSSPDSTGKRHHLYVGLGLKPVECV